MPYNDVKKIFEDALQLIEKNNLFFIEDVIAFLPISKPTFYDYFKVNSDEFNTIKSKLAENKIKTKSSIRAKLYKGKGMELIALYKILANEDELKALNGQYHDHTTKGDKINQVLLTKEEQDQIEKNLEDKY